jgi:hypothetical protein
MAASRDTLIVATDAKVFFITGDPSADSSHPLEPLLSGLRKPALAAPARRSGRSCVLVVPDHWFRHDTFAFQSSQDDLIRAFLERKLAAAYAATPHAAHFFGYAFQLGPAGEGRLNAFCLEEEKGFRLHEALCEAGFLPRAVTTPGMLWALRVGAEAPEFAGQAALVVHLLPQAAFLYFYSAGDLLFSRRVALPVGEEASLLFEINQSLYLFSQKTKGELDRIYLIDGAGGSGGFLRAAFEQQLVDLDAGGERLAEEIGFIQGIRQDGRIPRLDPRHAVTHRRIRARLQWRPVQWAGMVAGALLALLLGAEAAWLERAGPPAAQLRSTAAPAALALPELDAALDDLMAHAGRPSAAAVFGRLSAALPDQVHLTRIKLDLATATLELTAAFPGDSIDDFRRRLKSFVKGINAHLRPARPVGIEDFVLHAEDRPIAAKPGHQVTLKAVLR